MSSLCPSTSVKGIGWVKLQACCQFMQSLSLHVLFIPKCIFVEQNVSEKLVF